MSLFGNLFSGLVSRPYTKVSAEQARELVDKERALLVDVREDGEWSAGRAPQARHIRLADLPRRMNELPKNRPVVTVCRSGHRSARAAATLGRAGYTVYNLHGGMHAWARAGHPVVAGGRRPGVVA